MIEIRRIVDVKAAEGFTLRCEMENGDVYKYDMLRIIEGPGLMVLPLRKFYFFEQVYLGRFGHLAWPNGYEIHANTVVRDGKLISSDAAA